jgi:excinuclease ABC subunit A
MSFLPTMRLPCETCSERRYDGETLSVKYRGRSIADVLEMSASEALELLGAVPRLRRPLTTLEQVGLGYITLVRPGGPGTLIVLEEPTTGLHTVDVTVLVEVLHRLVDGGASVIVVEHNLDVICEADHIIDMGPEGGDAGGRVVAQGTPLELARQHGTDSHTARFLTRMMTEGRLVADRC